jgi:hypothetical protein
MVFKCGNSDFYLGDDVLYCGAYDPDGIYSQRQVVSYDGTLWEAQADDVRSEPNIENKDWSLVLNEPNIANNFYGTQIFDSVNDLKINNGADITDFIVYVRSRYPNPENIVDTPKLYYFDPLCDRSTAGGYCVVDPFEVGDTRQGCYVMRDRKVDIGWLVPEAELLTIVTPAADGVAMGYNQMMMDRADFIASYNTLELMTLEDVLVVYDENKARLNAFVASLTNFMTEAALQNIKDEWIFTFKALEDAQKTDDQNVLLHIEDLVKIFQTSLRCSYSIVGQDITIKVTTSDSSMFFYDIEERNYNGDILALPTWVQHKAWYYAATNQVGINTTSVLIKEEYLCTDGTTSNVPCG